MSTIPTALNEYVEGDIVDCYTPTPFATEAGVATDPSTLTFKYSVVPPGAIVHGATTTIAYTGQSVQSSGVVARLGTGDYSTWLDTTGKPGLYTWEYIATGAAQVTKAGQFVVIAPPL